MKIKLKNNRTMSIEWAEWDFGRYKYHTVTLYFIGWILISVEKKED
jgi:hypothetical protein